MVRLSDIPKEDLEKIIRFIKEHEKEYPVWNDTEFNLVKLIEKEFGYKLSPAQVYSLRRGEKIYRIKLDVEAIRELEREFGSVSKGVKEILKIYKTSRLPEHLKEYHKKLLQRGEVDIRDVPDVLGVDYDEAWKIIGELSKYGYVQRVGDKFKVFRFPVDPVLSFFFGGR